MFPSRRVRVRVRRANPEQLYKTCKATGGDCPVDVIKRYEQSTPADNILKYGSIGVYFGGLGIGTGRTGGGTVLGTSVGAGRPSLPVGTIGPREILPVDVGGPPEEIPLIPIRVPRPTDPFRPTVVEDPFVIIPPERPNILHEQTFPTEAPELPSVTTDITTIPNQYDVTGGSVDIQIVEQPILPEDALPSVITRTQYSNPTFDIDLGTNLSIAETSSSDNIIVGAEGGGTRIGTSEDIELQTFTRDTFDTDIMQETAFDSSTPERPVRVQRYPLRPYGRQYTQIRLPSLETALRPRTVTFENPAFEGEVSAEFDADVADLREEYGPLNTLSRVRYQQRPTGVRVSRVGQRRGTVTTRTGREVGSAAHYFYDISPIAAPVQPSEALELQLLSDTSAVAPSSYDDFEEIDLTDLQENIDNALVDTEETERPGAPVTTQVTYSAGGIEVTDVITVPFRGHYPTFDTAGDVIAPAIKTNIPAVPVTPTIVPYMLSGLDYDIHPSLLKRKRKRRPRFFVADGSVAPRT